MADRGRRTTTEGVRQHAGSLSVRDLPGDLGFDLVLAISKTRSLRAPIERSIQELLEGLTVAATGRT